MPEFSVPIDKNKSHRQLYIRVQTPYAIPADRELSSPEIEGHLRGMTIKLVDSDGYHHQNMDRLCVDSAITRYQVSVIGELIRNYVQLNQYIILEAYRAQPIVYY